MRKKASNGFLYRFKEREGITGQSVCGEEKSVDQDIVHAWSERLPDICRNYSPRDRPGFLEGNTSANPELQRRKVYRREKEQR